MHDDSGSNHHVKGAFPPARTAVAWLIRVAIVTLCLPVHGCDTVNGGAVELSWKLRPVSSSLEDKFVDCLWGDASNAIAQIRLHWEVSNSSEDPTGKVGSQAWSCGFSHGVTGFDLAEGLASLWVTPECADGQPAMASTYIAPAIVQRSVIRGDTVSLGAVELVVSVLPCGVPNRPPCICSN
jgi:hypothetical protein